MGEKHPGQTYLNKSSKRNSILSKNRSKPARDIEETEGPILLHPKVQTYGLLDSQKETENFLLANPEIIDAHSVLQLLEWSSTIKDDSDVIFNNIIRQCVYIIYLHDLSCAVNVEPLQCVSHFFEQIQQPSYLERFEKEVLTYQAKLKTMTYREMLEEVVICSNDQETSVSSTSSEEDIIPLDPLQAYTSLPSQLKQCLNDEDLMALEYELSLLSPKRAKDYFSRMLRSGLLLLNEADDTCTNSDTALDSDSSSTIESELVDYLKEKVEETIQPLTHDEDLTSLYESSVELLRN